MKTWGSGEWVLNKIKQLTSINYGKIIIIKTYKNELTDELWKKIKIEIAKLKKTKESIQIDQ